MLHHRHEIEALRGWAVLLVVAAHAGVNGLAGGFIGVDVFFVISGYLITQLLLKELKSTGKIDFASFYARRVRRLLPALAFLITGVAALLYWLPIPIDQEPQRKAAIASMLWMANVHFSLMDMDYFGPQASDNVFLHLWSLGVEEQFYLIWPLLLLAIHRLFRSPSPAIAVILVASLFSGMLAFVLWPVHAYYQMPFRLWQLAAGGLLAASPWFAQASLLSRHKTTQAALGTGLLVLACTLLSSESHPYPGPLALLPTLAAMLLINAGGEHGLSRFISNPLSRGLGAISYSLYLWHWPLLLMAKALAPGSTTMTFAAILLAILLAWFSWRLIEGPTRRLEIRRPRRWLTVSALVTGAGIAVTMNLPPVNSMAEQEQVSQQLYSNTSMPRIYQIPNCDDWYSSDTVVECVVTTAAKDAPRLLLVGDSIGAQWAPALEIIALAHGWQFSVYTKSACPMLDIEFHYPRINRRYTECEAWRDKVLEVIAQSPPDVLVLGSTSGYPFGAEEWENSARRFLKEKLPAQLPVRYLAPSPVLPFDPRPCLLRKASKSGEQLTTTDCAVDLAQIQRNDLLAALQRASAQLPQVRIIDTAPIVCPGGSCPALVGGIPAWRDNQHLNAAYVETLAVPLEQALDLMH